MTCAGRPGPTYPAAEARRQPERLDRARAGPTLRRHWRLGVAATTSCRLDGVGPGTRLRLVSHVAIWFRGCGCLLALACTSALVVACTPPVVSSPFIETVAENESSVGYVAEIHEVGGSVEADRYVPIRPRADSVVDSVGDLNTATNAVWLWDAACLSRVGAHGARQLPGSRGRLGIAGKPASGTAEPHALTSWTRSDAAKPGRTPRSSSAWRTPA